MDTTDTDGDGLYDIYETAGMMLPNGQVMYSNPLKEDTDEDGLPDAEEMGVISEYGEQPKLIQFILDIRGFDSTIYAEYFDYMSDPNEEDTDGDGLLDGKPIIIDSVKIAPKDPNPLITNGPKGIWKEQIKQAEEGNIPTEYGDWYDIDYFKGWGLGGIWPSALTGLGSYILMFREDNMGIALHSDASNFQQVFGYNKFYDFAFYLGTFGNINKEIFRFKSSGEEYAIWIWLGDYLNLGSGAEIGMYTNPHVLENVKIKQWDVVDFLLPMSLSLFNYYDEDNIENIFCWAPKDEQWWITGFNPEYYCPKAEDMVMIGSIDFLVVKKCLKI